MVFGGVQFPTLLSGATWLFDGLNWQLGRGTGPSARYGAALAYDPIRMRVVLFGGGQPGSPLTSLGDTWEWDGSHWAQVGVTGPDTRAFAAMTYEGASGRILLFGGQHGVTGGGTTSEGDTWEYDGSSWSQVATAGPNARFAAAMVYHAASNQTVLYGGSSGDNNTWLWNGSVWSLSNAAGPGARSYHGMVYDSSRHVAVLHGGDTGLSDTWEFDGVSWSRQNGVNGPARGEFAMVYESARMRTWLTGGNPGSSVAGDVWEYNGSPWLPGAIRGR